jgi:phosphohistidine phosphatase
MAKQLHQKGIKPDLLITSPAKRALTTAEFFAHEFEISPESIEKRDLIYDRGYRQIKLLIEQIANDNNTVLLFGHNPDITALAALLTGNFSESLPTCGILCIDFPIEDWQFLESVQGKMRFSDFPKKYKEK